MVDGLQVHPQLVGAPREGLKLQAAATAMRLQQAPAGAAGFARWIHAIKGWAVLKFGNRPLDQAVWLIGHPMHIRHIALLHLPFGKHPAQLAMQL